MGRDQSGTGAGARTAWRIIARNSSEKMMIFADQITDEKYRLLGFSPDGMSMTLTIESVSICAVEYPVKCVVLIFTSIKPRTASHYEVSLPESCSVEQIAGLIYANIVQNFRDSATAFKGHFRKLGLSLSRRFLNENLSARVESTPTKFQFRLTRLVAGCRRRCRIPKHPPSSCP
jgi:hypothetical protein